MSKRATQHCMLLLLIVAIGSACGNAYQAHQRSREREAAAHEHTRWQSHVTKLEEEVVSWKEYAKSAARNNALTAGTLGLTPPEGSTQAVPRQLTAPPALAADGFDLTPPSDDAARDALHALTERDQPEVVIAELQEALRSSEALIQRLQSDISSLEGVIKRQNELIVIQKSLIPAPNANTP